MLLRQCILAINGIIITFTLSLSEVTLICENRQKYAHFENLICEKKFGTWRLCSCIIMVGGQGCSQDVFFTEVLAEFQHVNCMIVRIWEVKRVACYARDETFTEAVASIVAIRPCPEVRGDQGLSSCG